MNLIHASGYEDFAVTEIGFEEAEIPSEKEPTSLAGIAGIVGSSTGLRQVLQEVAMVAPTESTVLLQGETGTGKELIARAIHDTSPRRNRPLVRINCAAIPSGLLESELFGHERGAFTGAVNQRIGRIEVANQGSLFLDEIGDIPLDLQPKLLRALQEREFERLGSTLTRKVNVRIVAATHRHLEEMIRQNQFRSDLFYRLNVFPIYIPPLRDRPEDIPQLVRHFADEFARRMQKVIEGISEQTMETLMQYPWPGNIRELQNIIERSVVLHQRGELRITKPRLWQASVSSKAETLFRRSAIEDRRLIDEALAESHGRVAGPAGAAAILGIPPSTLESKIRAMNINKHSFKSPGGRFRGTREFTNEVSFHRDSDLAV